MTNITKNHIGVIYHLLYHILFYDFAGVKFTKTQQKQHQEFLNKLGERIVQLRKIKKLSQNDLANTIGWDKPNLRKIEHGRGNPTVKTLLLIAEGLDISFQELTEF
ncbi:MAG: helix-turn-helix transcriptional regulator [Bacteroidota bacterium]